jgi:photosystem II stability/assembly factor-like uncharacterized protein
MSGLVHGPGILVGVGADGIRVADEDATGWTEITPFDAAGVAYGASGFVAVGSLFFHHAANGWQWSRYLPAEGCAPASDVAHGAGRYVSVGPGGAICASPEGKTWSRVASPTETDLLAVGHAGSRFVAAGAAGTLLTSPDGLEWTLERSGADLELGHVAHRQGITVAAGGRSVLVAIDGGPWSAPSPVFPAPVDALVAGPRVFLAFASGAVLESTDGTTWTQVNPATRAELVGVAAGEDLVVAIASDGSSMTSGDGVTWLQHPAPACEVPPDLPEGHDPCTIHAVASDGTRYVAVGSAGRVMTSTDGATWRQRRVAPPDGSWIDLTSVAHVGGTFVAAAPGRVLTSADGETWGARSVALVGCCGRVAHGNGLFVAPGYGAVSVSPDAGRWSAVNSGLDARHFRSVAWNGQLFVTAAESDSFVSPDGRNWSRAGSLDVGFDDVTNVWTLEVAHGGASFLALMAGNHLVESRDGRTWARRHTTWPQLLRLRSQWLASLAYHRGRWIVVGRDSLIGTLE